MTQQPSSCDCGTQVPKKGEERVWRKNYDWSYRICIA